MTQNRVQHFQQTPTTNNQQLTKHFIYNKLSMQWALICLSLRIYPSPWTQPWITTNPFIHGHCIDWCSAITCHGNGEDWSCHSFPSCLLSKPECNYCIISIENPLPHAVTFTHAPLHPCCVWRGHNSLVSFSTRNNIIHCLSLGNIYNLGLVWLISTLRQSADHAWIILVAMQKLHDKICYNCFTVAILMLTNHNCILYCAVNTCEHPMPNTPIQEKH